MGYWDKDGSYVRDASDDTPRMTQGDTWEAGQRVVKGMQDWELQENRRKEAEKESRVEFYDIRKNIDNQRMDAIDYERNQMQATRIIVEQNRQELDKKGWFRKGIAKLRGKTFAKTRNEIEDYATRRVENMSPEQLERFIENNSEQKGRSR